jgi:hypothetical protein
MDVTSQVTSQIQMIQNNIIKKPSSQNKMEIILTLRVSEEEYTQWGDFDEGGIDLVKKQLIKDIRNELDSLGIEGDLEIKSE